MKMLVVRCLAFVTTSSLAFVLAPAALHAQGTGAIRGIVTAEGTGAPVGGAQVSVIGDPRVVRTDQTGLYHLGLVPAGARTVRVLSIGYAAKTLAVTVVARDSVTANFALVEALLSLDAIVVTGTAAESRKKEVGNAMATIVMAALPDLPVSNTQEVLAASAPGITVLSNEGQPGAGGTIRLRGTNSVTQGNNPIIYVDGIRIFSDQSPLAGGSRQTTNPFNDIDPEDIERMEIVKGAAATTLYGTQASGGVIQIFTKHGSAGAPQWGISVGEGYNYEGHVGPSSDPTGLTLNHCSGIITSGAGVKFMDPTCPASGTWFQHGAVQRFDLNVKGGGDVLTYSLSGHYNEDQGVVRPGQQNSAGFRGNFTFSPGRNLIFTLNFLYDKNTIDWVASGNNTNGFTLNVMRGPVNNFKGGTGTDCAGVPAGVTCITNGYILNQQITNNSDHFITGFTVGWNPVAGLTNRFNAGFDDNFNNNGALIPFGFLALPTGSLNNTQWNHTKVSLDYAGSYQHSLLEKFASTLSWGAQAFDDGDRLTSINATNLSGPGQPTLASFATITLGSASQQSVVNGGFFLQEMLGWRDRLFVTGGVRVDGNSAFGQSFGLQTYPKVSVAYVLSEEKWWPTKLVPTLKLRGAIGESGKAPGAFASVRTWTPVAGDQGQPGVSVAQIGNPNLGPEITRESEVGFDMSILHDRLSFEVTGFAAHVERALIGVVAPPSDGFSNSQQMNVGTLDNKGLEVGLNAGIIRSAKIDWSARVNLTSLASKVGDVGGVPISTGLGSYVTQGYPVASYFGYKVTNPTAIANPVIAANQYLGSAYPTHLLSGSTSIEFWRNLTLEVVVEAQAGAIVTNFVGFQGAKRYIWQPCYAAQAALRLATPTDQSALSGVDALDRARCSLDGAVQNSDFFYSKTDFVKVRSISLAYRIPQRYLRGGARSATVSVALRNPFKWTKYDGVDPESSDQADAGSGLGRREYYQLPPYTTFLTTVRMTF
jgi:TonB-dependent SusC/RagA subfamily outer membrane receptor